MLPVSDSEGVPYNTLVVSLYDIKTGQFSIDIVIPVVDGSAKSLADNVKENSTSFSITGT